MTIERGLRGVAGFLILLSVALGYWLHPAFFLFTAFVGPTSSSPPSPTPAR